MSIFNRPLITAADHRDIETATTRRAALTDAAHELRNRRIENRRPYEGSYASNPQTYAGGELYEPGIPMEQPCRWQEVWPWIVGGVVILLLFGIAWLVKGGG